MASVAVLSSLQDKPHDMEGPVKRQLRIKKDMILTCRLKPDTDHPLSQMMPESWHERAMDLQVHREWAKTYSQVAQLAQHIQTANLTDGQLRLQRAREQVRKALAKKKEALHQ